MISLCVPPDAQTGILGDRPECIRGRIASLRSRTLPCRRRRRRHILLPARCICLLTVHCPGLRTVHCLCLLPAQEILWDLERMGLLRRAAPRANPSPGRVAGGRPAGRPAWKKVLRILLAAFFCLAALAVLIPMPHEVTPADYLLSKLVYLEIVCFPAVLCLNLFRLWNWAPLLRSKQRGLQALGVCLYLLIACIVIILSQAMAGALYSPEARQLIEMASA